MDDFFHHVKIKFELNVIEIQITACKLMQTKFVKEQIVLFKWVRWLSDDQEWTGNSNSKPQNLFSHSNFAK
jgi:hypothetical protein